MRIAIGSDHGGYNRKSEIIGFLKAKGYEILDIGTNSEESCDYTQFGIETAKAVRDKKADFGIVICKSGIGMSIVANKVKGVRAALCMSEYMARQCRKHNDANVLALSAELTNIDDSKSIVSAFLSSLFEAGRHKRRVDQITDYENNWR